jgi:hypothetical protein
MTGDKGQSVNSEHDALSCKSEIFNLIGQTSARKFASHHQGQKMLCLVGVMPHGGVRK